MGRSARSTKTKAGPLQQGGKGGKAPGTSKAAPAAANTTTEAAPAVAKAQEEGLGNVVAAAKAQDEGKVKVTVRRRNGAGNRTPDAWDDEEDPLDQILAKQQQEREGQEPLRKGGAAAATLVEGAAEEKEEAEGQEGGSATSRDDPWHKVGANGKVEKPEGVKKKGAAGAGGATSSGDGGTGSNTGGPSAASTGTGSGGGGRGAGSGARGGRGGGGGGRGGGGRDGGGGGGGGGGGAGMGQRAGGRGAGRGGSGRGHGGGGGGDRRGRGAVTASTLASPVGADPLKDGAAAMQHAGEVKKLLKQADETFKEDPILRDSVKAEILASYQQEQREKQQARAAQLASYEKAFPAPSAQAASAPSQQQQQQQQQQEAGGEKDGGASEAGAVTVCIIQIPKMLEKGDFAGFLREQLLATFADRDLIDSIFLKWSRPGVHSHRHGGTCWAVCPNNTRAKKVVRIIKGQSLGGSVLHAFIQKE